MGTPDYFYYYASRWEIPSYSLLTVSIIQYIRLAFGLTCGLLVVEEMFFGPTEFILVFANISVWAQCAGLFSILYQYKATEYES